MEELGTAGVDNTLSNYMKYSTNAAGTNWVVAWFVLNYRSITGYTSHEVSGRGN